MNVLKKMNDLKKLEDLQKYIENPENTTVDGRHSDDILYGIMDKYPNIKDIKLGFTMKDDKLDIEKGIHVFIYAENNENLPKKIGELPVIVRII